MILLWYSEQTNTICISPVSNGVGLLFMYFIYLLGRNASSNLLLPILKKFFLSFCLWVVGRIVFHLFYNFLSFYYRLFLFQPQIQSTPSSHSHLSLECILTAAAVIQSTITPPLLFLPVFCPCLDPFSIPQTEYQVHHVTALPKTIQLVSNSL